MPIVNATDITHSLIPEATFGTTPTSSATRYEIPASADQALLQAAATKIDSDTKRPNGSGNGFVRGMVNVTGSLDLNLSAAPVFNILLASALRGTFASKVLKGGLTDSSFSVLTRMDGSAAAGSQMVKVFPGCVASSVSLNLKANGAVTAAFDIMGVAQNLLTTDNALAVTAVANNVNEFIGGDVTAVSIGGTSLSFSEIQFKCAHNRVQRSVLGSNNGIGFGTQGARDVTCTIKAYRDSFTIDSAITGTPQAVTFDIGTTGNGWRIQLPAAIGLIPTDELADGSAYVSIELDTKYDTVSGTDVIVTQL